MVVAMFASQCAKASNHHDGRAPMFRAGSHWREHAPQLAAWLRVLVSEAMTGTA
jgi:hypothetical protein